VALIGHHETGATFPLRVQMETPSACTSGWHRAVKTGYAGEIVRKASITTPMDDPHYQKVTERARPTGSGSTSTSRSSHGPLPHVAEPDDGEACADRVRVVELGQPARAHHDHPLHALPRGPWTTRRASSSPARPPAPTPACTRPWRNSSRSTWSSTAAPDGGGPPQNYEGKPAFQFIRDVPVTWDETRVLSAEVGDFIVAARRKGDAWYLGAITDENARELEAPLSFLQPDTEYEARIYADGKDADWEKNPSPVEISTRTVTSADTLNSSSRERRAGVSLIRRSPSLRRAKCSRKKAQEVVVPAFPFATFAPLCGNQFGGAPVVGERCFRSCRCALDRCSMHLRCHGSSGRPGCT